jgi:carboxylesterase
MQSRCGPGKAWSSRSEATEAGPAGHHAPMSTNDPRVMPCAEPFSATGGPHGALVVHGFSGTPQSMRGLAEAFAAAGFAVELPLLPGHGTSVDDMGRTTFADWSGAVAATYDELASRCDRIVVAGLSMGATLATWLTVQRPEVAGLIVINGAFAPPEPNVLDAIAQMRAQGTTRIPGPGNDVADPDQTELAYAEVATAAMYSLLEALEALQDDLSKVRCPSLVITSDQDHVVAPASSDHFATSVAGPVERMRLTRSFHVATIDYERDEIEAAAVDFARRVTDQP